MAKQDYQNFSKRVYVGQQYDYVTGKKKDYRPTIKVLARTQKEADFLIEQERRKLVETFNASGKLMTLNQLRTEYYTVKNGLKPTTKSTDLQSYEVIEPHFGNVRLIDLTTDAFRLFFESLKARRKSLSYQHNIFKVVNKYLNFAVKQGHINYNPLQRLSDAAYAKAPEVIVDPTLVDKITDFFQKVFTAQTNDTFQDVKFKAMVLLAADGCLRRGELMALRWSKIRLDEGWMMVDERVYDISKRIAKIIGCETRDFDTPKTKGSVRKLPLSAVTCYWLTEYKRLSDLYLKENRLNNPEDYVLFSHSKLPNRTKYNKKRAANAPYIDVKLISTTSYRDLINSYCKKYKVEHFKTHDIRKVFYTLRINEGCQDKYNDYVLGHSLKASDVPYTLSFFGLAQKNHLIFESALNNIINPAKQEE